MPLNASWGTDDLLFVKQLLYFLWKKGSAGFQRVWDILSHSHSLWFSLCLSLILSWGSAETLHRLDRLSETLQQTLLISTHSATDSAQLLHKLCYKCCTYSAQTLHRLATSSEASDSACTLHRLSTTLHSATDSIKFKLHTSQRVHSGSRQSHVPAIW